MKLILVFACCLVFAKNARSGGFNVGNGGDGIYCAKARFIDGDNEKPGFVDLGHHYFSLEHFRILQYESLTLIQVQELRKLRLLEASSVRNFLYEKLKAVPEIYELIQKTDQSLHFDNQHYLIPGGFPDLKDDAFLEKLPEDCEKFQAIIRQETTFYWNMRFYGNIPAWEKEILRFHEIIYYVGATQFRHQNSRLSQNFLISLIINPVDKDTLMTAFRKFSK